MTPPEKSTPLASPATPVSPDKSRDPSPAVDAGSSTDSTPQSRDDSTPTVETSAALCPPLPAAASPCPVNVRDILDAPVTRHMGSAAPLLRVDHTVEQSLDLLRRSREIGRVVYFYVVDENRQLKGVVASRKLLLSSPETPIAEIMSERVIAIPARSTVLDACEFFTLHKLLAFPVVDDEKHVLGVVDVDLYTSEILEIDRRQDSDDLFQLIGVHLSEASQKSSRLAFVGRFPWLLCNVLGGMLSAFIADAYDDVSTLVVVAPFIALVTALAESVSIQSVSLALQALHAQKPTWPAFTKKAMFELTVGALLGVACGAAVAVIAFLWKGSVPVSLSLFLGIAGGVTASAVVGLSIPFVLRLIRRDPQLASGPIALALSDVVTLLFYFNLGRWVL